MDRAATRRRQAQTISTDAARTAGIRGEDENSSADRAPRCRAFGPRMKTHRHHWLTRLYPPSWRRRYGDEMDELLSHGCGWRVAVDVAKAAMVERLLYSHRTG